MTIAEHSLNYANRRRELEHYFDRTALDAWKKLTSDAPVGRIRATVRAGRDAMREILLGWLPTDLRGQRLLDAGCGTGAATVAAAARGAQAVGVDISPSLIALAVERTAAQALSGSVQFLAGDMQDQSLGRFDHVIAMDSLIHYDTVDMLDGIERMCRRTEQNVIFTVAPWTPVLAAMHALGRLLPAGDRAPDIVPTRTDSLRHELEKRLGDKGWRVAASHRVSTGFYKSHAFWLQRG